MKAKKLLLAASMLTLATPFITGCAAKILEKEINVVFMNEGAIVDTGTVTQFKNIKTPSISKAYIPTDFKFLGWTSYTLDELDYDDATHFKSQYIGDGRMVHYMDVKPFVSGETVVLNALMLHKDDIPKDYHYAVVAWYDKAATSGLSADNMAPYETAIKDHLLSTGVSQDDVNSIVFRAYSGNVGPTTGQILYDDDVDIMFGWGDVNNISTTGSIPAEMVRASQSFTVTYEGADKTRYIHRLTDNQNAIGIMDFMTSEAMINYFKK